MPGPDLSFLARDVPPDPGCAEARVHLGRYLTGGLERGTERRFREHLVGCAECRDVYRQALQATARLGRAHREEREAERRDARRKDTRRRILANAGPGRARRFRLQLVLIPAALIVLLVRLDVRGASGLSVARTGGEGVLVVAGQPLAPGAPAVEASRGTWCTSQGEAGAVLEGDGLRLEVGADSGLLVEGNDPPRVRLQHGELAVGGACTVETARGVVQVDGRARVAFQEASLSLSCLEGTLRLIDPTGTREIRAGEELHVDRAGAVTSGR